MAMAGGIFLWAGAAVSSAVVVNPPVYVNKPAKKWAQVEQTTNYAVHASAAQPAKLQPPIEPQPKRQRWQTPDLAPNLAARTFPPLKAVPEQQFRRAVQQPDIAPNIAGRSNEASAVERAPTYQAYKPQRFAQPDPSPNLAAQVTSASQVRCYVDPVTWRARAQQPDLTTNVAIRATVVVTPPLTRSPDPQLAKRYPPQIDLYPNLAGAQNEVAATARAPFFMAYKARRWLQPDLTPNLSLGTTAVVSRIAIAQDLQPAKRRVQQPEVYPNLAVNVVMTSFTVSTDDALTIRKWSSVDLYPNLAARTVAAVTYMPVYAPEASFRRKWTQVDLYPNVALTQVNAFMVSADDALAVRKWATPDLYPNLAANAVVQAPRVSPAFDPWINKRYPPQIDVYPNLASNFIAETVRVPPLPVEPWISIRYAPQVVEFPNLVISVPFTPPIMPPTDDHPSGGWERHHHHPYHSFQRDYEEHRQRRARRHRDDEEREREVSELAAVDREIAALLHAQEARDAEASDLRRMQQLADQYAGTRQDVPRSIAATLLKAHEERSRNALEQLQREMRQMLEDEEMALMMLLLNDD